MCSALAGDVCEAMLSSPDRTGAFVFLPVVSVIGVRPSGGAIVLNSRFTYLTVPTGRSSVPIFIAAAILFLSKSLAAAILVWVLGGFFLRSIP